MFGQLYGPKTSHFRVFGHTKCCTIIFSKTHFGPTFDPMLVPKQPVVWGFWYFQRATKGHHWLKSCQNHLFWHPTMSRIAFKETHFSP